MSERFKPVPIDQFPSEVIAAVGTLCNWLHFSDHEELKIILVSDETKVPKMSTRTSTKGQR